MITNEVTNFSRGWKSCLSDTIIYSLLSVMAFSGFFAGFHHRISGAFFLLSMVMVCYAFRPWLQDFRVSSLGFTRRNVDSLHWDNIEAVTFENNFFIGSLVLKDKTGGPDAVIPWPVNRPEEFRTRCKEFGGEKNPLVIFLQQLTPEMMKRGQVLIQYCEKPVQLAEDYLVPILLNQQPHDKSKLRKTRTCRKKRLHTKL